MTEIKIDLNEVKKGIPQIPLDLLSTTEVAKILKCSRAHVHNLIKSKTLMAYDISEPGKRPKWAISQKDLQAFLIVRHQLREAEYGIKETR